MKEIKEFIYPSTIEEAVEALGRGMGKARIIAGGTSVALSRETAEKLVDLTRLGLDGITLTNGVCEIEACVTAHKLAASEEVKRSGLLALVDAACKVGPAGVRNAVTVGGNVVQCFLWSDLPVALSALSCQVFIQGKTQRTMDLAELLARHPTKLLMPDEIVTRFRVALPPKGGGNAFVKFSRTEVDHALISAAVSIELALPDGGAAGVGGGGGLEVKGIKVVVGAAQPLPVPILGLDLLAGPGVRFDEPFKARVVERARAEAAPLADLRASVEYRTRLVGVVVEDALELAAARARERLLATRGTATRGTVT